MSETPDILCINCEDMISFDKILIHSSICIKPTSQVIKLTKSNYNSQIQYRTNRLKSSIESILYTDRFLLTEDQRSKILLILNNANQLISIQEPKLEAIDQCTEISSTLRRLSDSIAPSLLVYSERLRNLALEKTYCFLEYLSSDKESGIVKQFIVKKSQELIQMKNKIKKYNQTSMILQNTLKSYENLDEVKSEVESVKTINSSVTSPMIDTSLKDELEDLDYLLQHKKQEEMQRSLEDLKKYFYSKCLLVKLSFPSRHPAQYIQIPELYSRIKQNNVPLENWEEYIREEFNHPERWVNLKVIPK